MLDPESLLSAGYNKADEIYILGRDRAYKIEVNANNVDIEKIKNFLFQSTDINSLNSTSLIVSLSLLLLFSILLINTPEFSHTLLVFFSKNALLMIS